MARGRSMAHLYVCPWKSNLAWSATMREAEPRDCCTTAQYTLATPGWMAVCAMRRQMSLAVLTRSIRKSILLCVSFDPAARPPPLCLLCEAQQHVIPAERRAVPSLALTALGGPHAGLRDSPPRAVCGSLRNAWEGRGGGGPDRAVWGTGRSSGAVWMTTVWSAACREGCQWDRVVRSAITVAAVFLNGSCSRPAGLPGCACALL